MNLEPIFRCPFCSRHDTRGVVAFDRDRLLLLGREDNPIDETVDWYEGESRQIFVFDPDGARNAPCPHAVSFVFDAGLSVPLPGGDRRSLITHSQNWDHPRLLEHDPDNLLQIHLWEMSDDGTTAFYPRTRYEMCFLSDDVPRMRRLRRPRRNLFLGGTTIVAADVSHFLFELRDGFERLQAFYARAERERD